MTIRRHAITFHSVHQAALKDALLQEGWTRDVIDLLLSKSTRGCIIEAIDIRPLLNKIVVYAQPTQFSFLADSMLTPDIQL